MNAIALSFLLALAGGDMNALERCQLVAAIINATGTATFGGRSVTVRPFAEHAAGSRVGGAIVVEPWAVGARRGTPLLAHGESCETSRLVLEGSNPPPPEPPWKKVVSQVAFETGGSSRGRFLVRSEMRQPAPAPAGERAGGYAEDPLCYQGWFRRSARGWTARVDKVEMTGRRCRIRPGG